MKKRKILYLFPLTALILSGCTLEEGLANAKSWAKEMLSPVLNLLRGDTGGEEKKEEKKDDEKPSGEDQKPDQGGQEGDKPQHAGTESDPYTGADAVLVAEGLDAGGVTSEYYYIKGEVTQFQEEFNASYGNYSFMIKGGFIGWRLKLGADGKKFGEGDIEIGDTVLMYAQIQAYGEDKLAETKGGYVVSVEKKAIDAELLEVKIEGTPKTSYLAGEKYTTEGLKLMGTFDNGEEIDVSVRATWEISKETAEVGDTSITITAGYLNCSNSISVDVEVIDASQTHHAGTAEDPFDAVDAIVIAKTLQETTDPSDRHPSEQSYYIKGVVQEMVESFNPQYGNFTFLIEHGFEGYRLKNGKDQVAFENADDLEVGDTVTMYAQILNFKGTYETNGGYIAAIEKPPVAVESVELSEQALALEVGQQAALSASVLPAKASQEVQWSIDQTSQVVSYENGMVKALEEGEATITATSVADPTVSASCTVTVTEATKTLQSIEIVGTPDKLAYYHGEAFDPSGLKVMAHYAEAEIDDEDVTANAPISANKENAEYGDTSVTFSADYSNEHAEVTFDITVEYKKGSEQLPYTVAEARDAIDNNGDKTGVYATGIVSEIVTAFSSQHNNVSFNISADGTKTADQLQAYRCVAASEDDVAVGDTVTVKGNLKKYNSTYEFDSGCTIVNRVQPTVVSVAISGTPAQTEYGVGDSYNHNGLVATATLSNGGQVDVTSAAVWTPSKATAEQGDDEISYTATYGGVESAAFPIEVTITSSPVIVPGSQEQPYTTAQAINAIDNNGNKTGVYTAGIVNRIAYAYSSTNKNMSFYFSDDGSTTNEVEAYKLSADTDPNVEVGDYVVVYGDLTKYSSTYEVNTGCTLAVHTKATVQSVTISGTASQTEYAVGASYNHNGLTATAHLSTNVDVDVTDKATWNVDPAIATLNDTSVSITATYGGVTSTAVVVNVTVTNDTPPADTALAAYVMNGGDASTTALTPAQVKSNFFKDANCTGTNIVSSVDTANKLYPDEGPSLKFASSSAKGELALTLSQSVSKIKLRVKAYDNGQECLKILVAGTEVTITKEYAEYEVTLSAASSSITIASKQATKNRFYITNLDFYK